MKPESDDEPVALAALQRMEASEEKLMFVFERGSQRFLKLSGPCEIFFNLTREQILANPEACLGSVEALDRASWNTFHEDLNRLGQIMRTVSATGSDGRRRSLRVSVMIQQVQGRSLVVGSVLDVAPLAFTHGPSSVLRAAIEEAKLGVAVTDAEGCYLYLNREHVTLFGYDTMNELIGKSWRVLYSEEGVRYIEQVVFPELAKTGQWQGRLQAKRKDGSVFHEALALSLLTGGGIVCNCHDVSAEVSLVERVERSEAMFRIFLNSLPTGVTIRNLNGDYEFVNKATSLFLGMELYQGNQPRGMEVCLSDQKVFAYWGATDQRVAKTGEAVRFDFPLQWGGREWVLYVEKLPLRIGSPDVTHVCTLICDVTEARRLEAASVDSARRRDEYLAMQREFISMVSHEFRTPLTAIQGLQHLMNKSITTEGGPSQTRLHRWLDLQGDALGALRELVDQVLLLNRLDHLGSVMPQQVELATFLTRIVEGLADSLGNQRLRMKLDLSRGLTVAIDETQMRALIENLISNALKYSAAIVTVEARTDESHWWLSVTDCGRGIPLKDQAKLFRPFFRASNIGKVSGTGLGLTIVQRSAAYHNGTVEVASREGEGAKFTARFPLAFPVHSPELPSLELERMPKSLCESHLS